VLRRLPAQAGRLTTERGAAMDGWLMWGLILPVLLVIAGIVTIQRRKR
jgi:hypothetical protein